MKKSLIKYQSLSPDIDENQFDDFPIEERVGLLAHAKVLKILSIDESMDCLIIAADTLTRPVQDDEIYTKQENIQKQYNIALQMSGRALNIYTGVSAFYNGQELETKTIWSWVKYQTFDEEDIKRLAVDDKPEIRSSALGMFTDAIGFTLVEEVKGSYTGAIGLPMEFVYENIRRAKEIKSRVGKLS